MKPIILLKEDFRNHDLDTPVRLEGLERLSGYGELAYYGGELTGEVTPLGFRISVRGSCLTANMDVIVRDLRQIVEIQFFDSALLGLTLILQKG